MMRFSFIEFPMVSLVVVVVLPTRARARLSDAIAYARNVPSWKMPNPK
jgi:hypothetical protein